MGRHYRFYSPCFERAGSTNSGRPRRCLFRLRSGPGGGRRARRRSARASRFPGHREEEILAAVGMVHVLVAPPEAGSFVDHYRTLVERGHGEREAVRRVTFSRELQTGKETLDAESLSGEVRPHTEPDIDCVVRLFELEEAGEGSVFVEDREIGILPTLRVEQLLEIVRIARRVVEIVGRLVLPAGDLGGLFVFHLPKSVCWHYIIRLPSVSRCAPGSRRASCQRSARPRARSPRGRYRLGSPPAEYRPTGHIEREFENVHPLTSVTMSFVTVRSRCYTIVAI